MVKGALIQNGVHLEDHEYETVKYFLDLGADIELIPPSQIKYLRMPDIIMNGISWEMKSPVGKGKYTIQNILQSAAGQSRNIIIDLRRCKMPSEEAINKSELPAFLTLNQSAASSGLTYTLPAVFFILSPERL